MTDIDRDRDELEDVFDYTADNKTGTDDLLHRARRGMGGDPHVYALNAAYYTGILQTLEWLDGDVSTDDLLDTSSVSEYKPSDE